MAGRPLNTWESVAILVDPTHKMGWTALESLEKHESRGNLWAIPPARGKEAHGRASWPVELPRRIIKATGAKRILDPFHGQGNTQRAVESFPDAEYYGVDLYKPESLTRL
jgi:DNA modification methylase